MELCPERTVDTVIFVNTLLKLLLSKLKKKSDFLHRYWLVAHWTMMSFTWYSKVFSSFQDYTFMVIDPCSSLFFFPPCSYFSLLSFAFPLLSFVSRLCFSFSLLIPLFLFRLLISTTKSFVNDGDFSVTGRIRSAIRDYFFFNGIYFFFGISKNFG